MAVQIAFRRHFPFLFVLCLQQQQQHTHTEVKKEQEEESKVTSHVDYTTQGSLHTYNKRLKLRKKGQEGRLAAWPLTTKRPRKIPYILFAAHDYASENSCDKRKVPSCAYHVTRKEFFFFFLLLFVLFLALAVYLFFSVRFHSLAKPPFRERVLDTCLLTVNGSYSTFLVADNRQELDRIA